jgi:hypothetical protein
MMIFYQIDSKKKYDDACKNKVIHFILKIRLNFDGENRIWIFTKQNKKTRECNSVKTHSLLRNIHFE